MYPNQKKQAHGSFTTHAFLVYCSFTSGDHEQLRPKVDSWELSVGHRKGLDLNRSLFERLVQSKFPFATLHEQHRMHEDIAHIVRTLTYPYLRTSARVTHDSHPMVKGMQHRVAFINLPGNKEDSHASLDEKVDGDNSMTSKVNSIEAEMMARTAKYLVQQGYSNKSIILLTPYLGQLTMIRDCLHKQKFDAELSALDIKELQKAEELAHGMGQQTHKGSTLSVKPGSVAIRTATIDNFQGEEGDIILVSMVRSNEQGQIGFTGDKERVNVLLSRARHGMIIFGSKSTLCTPVHSQWRQVFEVRLPSGALAMPVHEGVPVVCERHPNEKYEITAPSEFDQFVPEGGCKLPCKAMMACQKHHCTRLCHLEKDKCHSAQFCREKISIQCLAKKHTLILECRRATPASLAADGCALCQKEERELERHRQHVLQLEQEIQKAKLTLALELRYEEQQAEIELKKEEFKLAQEMNEKIKAAVKNKLEQHKKEVLAAKQQEHAKYVAQLEHQLSVVHAQSTSAFIPISVGATSTPVSVPSTSSIPNQLLTNILPDSAAFIKVQAQVLDSLAHMYSVQQLRIKLVNVQQVCNSKLKHTYEAAKKQREKEGYAGEEIVYHGTNAVNIPHIVQHNLSMSKIGKLDPGWFGAGLYFSPHADYALIYSNNLKPVVQGQRIKILQFAALPGKVQQLKELHMGQPKHSQFDSNRSTNKFELVLFEAKFCLPLHVLELDISIAAGAKFEGSQEQKGHSGH